MDSGRIKGIGFEESNLHYPNDDTLGVFPQTNRQANSSHLLFLADNQVHGPFYSPDEFKQEIDGVCRKERDTDVNSSPHIEPGQLSQMVQNRFKELDISHKHIQKRSDKERSPDKKSLSFHSGSNNQIWSSPKKLRTHDRISNDDEEEEEDEDEESAESQEQIHFQKDLSNSVEIDHVKQQRVLKQDSILSKPIYESTIVSKQMQRDDNIDKSLTQVIQNFPASAGIKNNRSSLFGNTTVGRNSLKEQRKFSLFSLQQQPLVQSQLAPFDACKHLDLQVIAREIGNEAFSKSYEGSEVCNQLGVQVPSKQNTYQGRSQGSTVQKQVIFGINSPNFKQGSWLDGDLTCADKSIAGDSMKFTGGFNSIWARSAFLILTLTKKFITNMKELSMKYKFSQMRETYFDLIDDKSTDYSYFHVGGYLKNDPPRFLERKFQSWASIFNRNCVYIAKNDDRYLKKMLSSLFTINLGVLLPDSYVKIFWDFVILWLLVINVFYIPLKISFDNTIGVTSYLLIFLEDVPSYAFLCDIFMNFNTAYYSKGKLNCKRSKIFKHYIRGSLIWDLLIVGPFLFSSIFNVRFLNIILLFRVSKIYKIVSSIEELLNLRHMQATLMGLVKLVVLIIYIAHIFGCLFYYMHVLQIQFNSSTVTWVVRYKFDQSEWTSLYISSVYWAVITMITLGYGDITPITSVEKIFVIFVTLISCGIFAYAINSIGYVIQDINKRSNEFRYKMSSLTNHMRQRELSNVMQMRVKKYFEYLHYEEQEDNEDGQKVLQQCTSQLKNEVLTEMYKKVLKSRKEFRLNFSKEFLTRLAPKMRESRLGPEEVIFQENEFCKRVFFLMRGNIALQRTRTSDGTDQEKQKDINIKILKKGDIFGLESFLSGSETNVAAKTLNVVQVVFLKEEDFLQVIQDFNSDKERFAMIKDKLNLMKAVRGLGINCYLCDSFMHQFLNCPYMSYQPNEKKILNQAMKNQIQIRQRFQRNRGNSTRPLADINLIQEQALKIMIQYNMFENPEQLAERIQMLENEGALQANAVEFIEQYIQDPKEVSESEDEQQKADDGTGQSFMIDQEPQHSNQYYQNDEESLRLKGEDYFGSSIKTIENKEKDISSIPGALQSKMKKYRSSLVSPSGSYYEEAPDKEAIILFKDQDRRQSIPKRPRIYSDCEKGLIFKGDGGSDIPWSPGRRKTPSENFDSSSVKILQGDQGTPILSPDISGKIKTKVFNNIQKINRQHRRLQQQQQSNSEIEESNNWNNFCSKQTRRISSEITPQNKNNTPVYDRIRYLSTFAQTLEQAQQITESQNDFMIILDFEQGQEWNVYLPHNNQSKILEQYQRLLDKRLSLLRKRKRKHHQTSSQQKYKQMQQLISSMQIKNTPKNFSVRQTNNPKSRTITNQVISPRVTTTQNQLPDPSSLMLIASPNNHEKMLSRSNSIENNQEIPHNIFSND